VAGEGSGAGVRRRRGRLLEAGEATLAAAREIGRPRGRQAAAAHGLGMAGRRQRRQPVEVVEVRQPVAGGGDPWGAGRGGGYRVGDGPEGPKMCGGLLDRCGSVFRWYFRIASL
jgi:hypothetical protein